MAFVAWMSSVALSILMMATSALAVEPDCGPRPAPPALFDPETATREEVMATKTAFEAYQDANTAYLDCLEAFAQSDDFAALGQSVRQVRLEALNAELNAVQETEKAIADDFNEKAKAWMETRKRGG
ncbi:MAG: hypothetical protein ACOY99_04975 [Pseudomonadota bacterium]